MEILFRNKLIEITKETKLWVWKRICKCFKCKIQEQLKLIINKEEGKDIAKILKQIQENLNKYYFKKCKDKKLSTISKTMKDLKVNI